MLRRTVAAAVVAGCIISSATIAWASTTDMDKLKGLSQAYVEAQFSFDQASVRRMTAPIFVEISPRGEVDERDEVIAFYAPEKRTSAPPFSIHDQRVRLTVTSAVITQTVTIGKPPRSMSLSQAITASRIGRDWKLTSSQSTPIPAPKP